MDPKATPPPRKEMIDMTAFRCWAAAACAGLLLLPLPRAAHAWGPEGHSIIASLALTQLTPAARAALDDILDDYKITDYEIASWADIIRGDKAYEERYPNNGRWHFIDFDVQQWYDENFALTLSADGNDVVSQIYRWRDDLADSGKMNDEERLNAIRFLVHLVGDMHQPLHCAYRYGDMGGNMLPVHSFSGENYSFDENTPMDYGYPSLHSVWDESMVHELVGNRALRTVVRELSTESSPEDIAVWTRGGDVLRWANDSYWIARKQVYRWTDGTKVPFNWARPGMDMTRENYIDSHLPIVRDQLKKGGARLGLLLNQALDPALRQPRFVPPAPATAPAVAEAESATDSSETPVATKEE